MADFLQTFKGTSIIRTVLLLLVSIFSLQATRAQDFITDVVLIGGSKSETDALKADYSDRGYTLINKDLNAGAGGDYIYLLYRKGSVFSNESFITDFYIKSGSGAPNSITDECGITYYLTPYDGGSHFKEQKGDLNSNTGANTASIHLYYTKQYINTFSAVNNIYFNSTKNGAVGENGDNSTGYDLNKGCGSQSEYIYLHTDKAEILPLSGSGTVNNPYLINNTNDWNIFARRVAMGLEPTKYYKLKNDIEVTTQAGNQDRAFYGWFYGNDKTITVNINGSGMGTAPFANINGATIRNLTVQGTVTSSGLHSSGLVGLCSGTNPSYIINCRVLANVSGTQYAGGIVGHGGNANLTMQNSYFGGSISGFSNYAGGLVGWCDNMTLTMRNCMFKGAFATNHGGAKYHPIVCKNGSSTVNAYLSRTFYVNSIAPTDLGNAFVPGAAGAPASTSSADGCDYAVVLADGQTYYAPSYFSQKLYYASDFETGLDGWTIVNGYTTNDPYGAGPSTGRIWTSDSNSGSNSFIFFPYNNQAQYLVSPGFDSTSPVRLSFFAKGEADQNVSFQIGYSKTTSDINAFNWTDTYTTLLSDWTYVSADLPAGVKYVAIKDLYVNDYSEMLIDDISVEELYPVPINITMSDKTDNSVTFSWGQPDPEVLSYTWKYRKTSNANDWIGGTTTTDTSVTLTGLEADTEYVLYLQANYGNGNSSNFVTATFSTQRSMVTLPHFQDFEEGMKGWEITNGANGTGITSELSHGSGSHSFVFEPGDNYQYLQSPLFEEDRTLDVEFFCKVADADHPASFIVAMSGINGADMQTSSLVTIDKAGWGKAPLQLPKGTRFFFIIWISGDKLYIDDISFHDYDFETGIKSIGDYDVYPINFNGNTPIYNLSGQQLKGLQKGINIINGKKILIK